MRLLAATILSLCAVSCHSSSSAKIRNYNVEYEFVRLAVPDRLLTMMRNLYVTGLTRTLRILPRRTEYENSVEFEEGYIMGEIIERYRQLVIHIKVTIKHKHLKVFDFIMRLDFVQKLYFEIYHLVMMMHEIPRKYGAQEGEEINKGAKFTYVSLAEKARQKAMEKEKKIRDLHKLHELMSNSGFSNISISNYTQNYVDNKKKKKKYWNVDYGWSIENW